MSASTPKTERETVSRCGDSQRVHKTIKEHFKDYNGDYEKIEIDWGKLEGKEVW